eukprot:scaffold2837_cov249-Chaetoceros_neogracile.AAC.6
MKTTSLTLAYIAATLSCVDSFSPGGRGNPRANTSLSLGGNPLESFSSFLKDGKKNLVKSQAGDYDAAAIQTRIKSLAKAVLDEKGAKYTVVELDQDTDGKAIRAEMADLVGRTSVPAIWIGGEFVGGCNDGPMGGINSLVETNKLDGMLESVGAL